VGLDEDTEGHIFKIALVEDIAKPYYCEISYFGLHFSFLRNDTLLITSSIHTCIYSTMFRLVGSQVESTMIW
jgi:hypothetical protein